jgi:predicted PhzF superfamily epimerase YddE/YHI9
MKILLTGSAHSQLIPFWAEKLNKKKMFAKQLSQRGGELECKWWGDRVTMSGNACSICRERSHSKIYKFSSSG